MIQLTPKAVVKVKEFAEDMGVPLIIRIGIKGGGCVGYKNDLNFDDVIKELDEVIEQDGIKVIIDPMSYQYLDEVTLDFTDGLMGTGFTFINPKAKSSCGCGNSIDF